jgi:hypothetical protein
MEKVESEVKVEGGRGKFEARGSRLEAGGEREEEG